MKKRYKARVQERYVIESVVKFDDDQTADVERLLEEFGNIVLKVVKDDPSLLDELTLPESRVKVS